MAMPLHYSEYLTVKLTEDLAIGLQTMAEQSYQDKASFVRRLIANAWHQWQRDEYSVTLAEERSEVDFNAT